MVLGEVDTPLTENFRNGPLATLDTIRNAHAPVAAASKGESRDLSAAILDQFDPLKVPERVLWHAEVPPEDT